MVKLEKIFTTLIIIGGVYVTAVSCIHEKKRNHVVTQVKGLSEKIIKSDTGTVKIIISCSEKDTNVLFEKRQQGKDAVYEFLKKHGFSEADVSDINYHSWVSTQREFSADEKIIKENDIFKSDDSIYITSKDVDKLKSLCLAQDELISLSQQGITTSFYQEYKISDFSAVKLALLKEASENAHKSAQALLAPNGQEVGKADYINQGEVIITSAESGGESTYDANEASSIYKKFRLVIRAGYMAK